MITGFGRLGRPFGTEVFGIEPDLIVVAKGVTSGYAPLSGLMVSEEVWRTVVSGEERFGVFGHGFTYTAHPGPAAAALANLDVIENDQLVAQVASRGSYLKESLLAAFKDHPLVGDVRGMGLMWGVEFVAGRNPAVAFDPSMKVAGRVVKEAFAQGVVGRALPQTDTIAFSPPFIISEGEIDTVVKAFREATDVVAQQLLDEGVWRPEA